MVKVGIEDALVRLEVLGLHKLWAFKRSIDIPLAAIESVRADPERARGPGWAIRMPGTHIPGLITAGTFHKDGKRVFWDVHKPRNSIVITLKAGRYDEVIVEVDNPDQAVLAIDEAIRRYRA